MPSSRPRGSYGAHGSQRTPVTPMSERQQMALLLQMTSQTNQPNNTTPSGHTRSKERNERGETTLHVAAIKGDQDQVKKLLDQGADPNATDFAGWTPLHEACSRGWYEIVVSLIEAGADVNARGLDDETPLHDAARNVNLKLVKFLIENGADSSLKNSKGNSVCDVATSCVFNYLKSIEKESSSQKSHSGRSRDDSSKKGPQEESMIAGENNCNESAMDPLKLSDDSPERDSKGAMSLDKTAMPANDSKDGDGQASGSAATSAGQDDNVTSTKRPLTDAHEHIEAETSNDDDATKKKKQRKDIETKESTPKAVAVSRGNVGRAVLPGTKPPGPASKTGVAPLSKGGGPLPIVSAKPIASSIGKTGSHGQGGKGGNAGGGLSGKSTSGLNVKSSGGAGGKGSLNVGKGGDRKSPCPSPKHPVHIQTKDEDSEDLRGQESSGPKVPPLKIVIPNTGNSQQESEGGSGQRVGGKGRDNGKDDKRQSISDEKASTSGQRVLRSHRTTDEKEKERSSPHSTNPASPNYNPGPSKTPPPSTSQQAAEADAIASTSSGSSCHSSQISDKMSSTASSATASTSYQPSTSCSSSSAHDLHPRKRKIKASKESHSHSHAHSASTSDSKEGTSSDGTAHNLQHTNPYQMVMNIRKQVERRQKNLYPVQPKPPQGFKDYLINRRTYLLQSNCKPDPVVVPPASIAVQMREEYVSQEKERHRLRIQHLVEKEKLVLAVEQEILRVHGRAARALANQSLPFSVCTLLRDKEIYNLLTPEQEEKERNAQRSRYNGRLFLSWLQDVDDKWEKIKEGMVRRHHFEAQALHATQIMNWEWRMNELGLCDNKSTPKIDAIQVPKVHVSDDFDLIPA